MLETYAEMIGDATISRIEKFGYYTEFIDPETVSVRDMNIVVHAINAIQCALVELLPDMVMQCGCHYRPMPLGEFRQNREMMCDTHKAEHDFWESVR